MMPTREGALASLGHPQLAGQVLRFWGRKLWRMRTNLATARGRVRQLSFLIHSFMDAEALNECRLQACVFKVITAHGPLSMCGHNARRDQFLTSLPAA